MTTDATAPSSTTTAGAGPAVSPAALSRLQAEAAGESVSAATALALTPYEYGDMPINPQTNPTRQDQSPSAQRLSGQQWQGYTSRLNHAQAAQDNSQVWVTVPVDKVVTSGQVTTANPVYSSTKGYVARPGESAGSIPPAMPAGRPY